MPGDGERALRQEARHQQQQWDDKHKEITNALKQLTEKTNKIDTNLDRQEQKLNVIEELTIECKLMREEMNELRTKNLTLENRMKTMQREIDDLHNNKNRKKIEIRGMQIEDKEIAMQAIIKLATAAKVTLSQEEIRECQVNKKSDKRQDTITVKFSSIAKRDSFAKEVKVFKANSRVDWER